MKKILIVGHSHITALQRNHPEENFEFHSLVGVNGLPDLIKKDISADNYQSIVFAVGGNSHNIFGLIKHPQTFDFYLPCQPELTIDKNAELLPIGLMISVFNRNLNREFQIIKTIRKLTTIKAYFIESPPPIPSETHIRKNPSAFRSKIEEYGISPAIFRYKLWKLQSELVEKYCANLEIDYIHNPQEAKDEQGLLAETYWNNDPSHGNAAYGALVLNQIRLLHYHAVQ